MASENTSAASTFELVSPSTGRGEGTNRPIALQLREGVAPRFFLNCPAFPGMLPQEIGEKGPRVRAFKGGMRAPPSFAN